MQQRVILNKGKRFLVNVATEDGIGPGFAVGQLVMKSATDGKWYVATASGSNSSVIAFVSQSALGFTSGPSYTQGNNTASYVMSPSFYEQNFPYQLVASTDGNAYAVYLTGTAPTVTFVVSQSAWGRAYITNSRNAIIDMAKPNLYLQSISDGNYYTFYLSSSGGTTYLLPNGGTPVTSSATFRILENGNTRITEGGLIRITEV
jgi:hypothetical protein